MGSQIAPCRGLEGCADDLEDSCEDASKLSSFPYLLGSRDFILQGNEKPVPERPGRNVALGRISALDSLDSGKKDGLKVVRSTNAVLVSELCGFKELTREHGIIHFASIIARMRQISYPIVQRHGCFHQSTEGDKMIVAFTDVSACVKAALEMQRAIWKHNDSLNEKAHKWKIRLNGVGIHCGNTLILDEDGHVFGDPFSRAAHLCENCCKDGNVLISEDVLAAIKCDPFFSTASFDRPEKKMPNYVVQMEPGHLLCEEVPTDDASCIPASMVVLCLRHSSKGLYAIDNMIKQEFVHQSAVLMFNLNLGVSSCADIASIIAAKRNAMELITPILQKHGGHSAEPMIWIFNCSTDAAQAAVEGKLACEKYNTSAHAITSSPVEILGWGIHEGSLLCLPGTDVHWGDPVNTASKLGLDLAENGDILVMPEVKSALTFAFVNGDDRLKNFYFEKRALTFSKSDGDFCYYCLHTTDIEGGHTILHV